MTPKFFPLKRIVKPLASLKLAVFVILLIATLTAAGTIVESRYDAMAASKWVYKTWWMYSALGLLAVNLTAVMIDRLPWKRRHLSFLLAHIGILLLLLGSLITMEKGLDGSMRVGIGESNRFVQGPNTKLTVWSSFDGDRYTKLSEQDVDFFLNRPSPEKPVKITTDKGDIVVTGYEPYVIASQRVVASENPNAGSGIQIQMQNDRVNVNEWLLQNKKNESTSFNLGPAQVFFGDLLKEFPEGNAISVSPLAGDKFAYRIFFHGKVSKEGAVEPMQDVETGWMGLRFKILRSIPRAEMKWDFKVVDRPSPMTNSAIRVAYDGREQWLQLDDVLKFFTDKAVYILTYGHERIDLGFEVSLKKFEVGRYPGTQRAASYQSVVSVPGTPETIISMNEPLKHQGLTIYQASFQDGPAGAPMASIFSVNHDPGRFLKYLGSLIISLGVVILFVDRRLAAKNQMAPRKWQE